MERTTPSSLKSRLLTVSQPTSIKGMALKASLMLAGGAGLAALLYQGLSRTKVLNRIRELSPQQELIIASIASGALLLGLELTTGALARKKREKELAYIYRPSDSSSSSTEVSLPSSQSARPGATPKVYDDSIEGPVPTTLRIAREEGVILLSRCDAEILASKSGLFAGLEGGRFGSVHSLNFPTRIVEDCIQMATRGMKLSKGEEPHDVWIVRLINRLYLAQVSGITELEMTLEEHLLQECDLANSPHFEALVSLANTSSSDRLAGHLIASACISANSSDAMEALAGLQIDLLDVRAVSASIELINERSERPLPNGLQVAERVLKALTGNLCITAISFRGCCIDERKRVWHDFIASCVAMTPQFIESLEKVRTLDFGTLEFQTTSRYADQIQKEFRNAEASMRKLDTLAYTPADPKIAKTSLLDRRLRPVLRRFKPIKLEALLQQQKVHKLVQASILAVLRKRASNGKKETIPIHVKASTGCIVQNIPKLKGYKAGRLSFSHGQGGHGRSLTEIVGRDGSPLKLQGRADNVLRQTKQSLAQMSAFDLQSYLQTQYYVKDKTQETAPFSYLYLPWEIRRHVRSDPP